MTIKDINKTPLFHYFIPKNVRNSLQIFVLASGKNFNFISRNIIFLPSAKPHGQHVVRGIREGGREEEGGRREGYPRNQFHQTLQGA